MVEFFHFSQLGAILLRRKTKEQDPKLFVSIPLPNGDALATHSSILAWRIPWTEEPGGPQSMGSLRVGHD